MNENGTMVIYGHDPEDHLTDVIARQAAVVIRREQAEGEPFFLYISTFSPHTPANPAPRHAGMFQDEPLPRPPSFVADKPAVIGNLPRLRPSAIGPLEALHRRRLESLQAVDDLVETVVRTLEATGQLDHTYIVYSSNNRHHLGHHR